MNLYDRSTVKLLDIASIERAKREKLYPAGSILIQVSATKGQMKILDVPQEVETKYAVIQLNADKVLPAYLFFVLNMVMPRFLCLYQTTINIQIDVFKHLELEIHNDVETQQQIVDVFDLFNKVIDDEQCAINKLKDFKQWHLDTMFC